MMGRSSYFGVSDGEWSTFATKVCDERDDALVRIWEQDGEIALLKEQITALDIINATLTDLVNKHRQTITELRTNHGPGVI
jgi:hypothetical protein